MPLVGFDRPGYTYDYFMYGNDKCYQYYVLPLQAFYRTASNSATTIAVRTFEALSLLLLITTGIIVG